MDNLKAVFEISFHDKFQRLKYHGFELGFFFLRVAFLAVVFRDFEIIFIDFVLRMETRGHDFEHILDVIRAEELFKTFKIIKWKSILFPIPLQIQRAKILSLKDLVLALDIRYNFAKIFCGFVHFFDVIKKIGRLCARDLYFDKL